MWWQTLLYDDPVVQMSLLYFVVLFLIALLPLRAQRDADLCAGRGLMAVNNICKLDGLGRQRRWSVGQTSNPEAPAFPELETSWSAQCTEWFCRAIERIRKR
jgi:hypothetical protein